MNIENGLSCSNFHGVQGHPSNIESTVAGDKPWFFAPVFDHFNAGNLHDGLVVIQNQRDGAKFKSPVGFYREDEVAC